MIEFLMKPYPIIMICIFCLIGIPFCVTMTPQDIANVLNDLFAKDPRAIDALVNLRVPVNGHLLDHPTAMCQCKNDAGDFPTMGLLGVIQAIVGKDGETIEACYDEERKVLIGFRVRPKKRAKKYTVVYEESWMSGSHRQTTTRMARITLEFGQDLNAVMKECDLADRAVFVLEGWPKHVNTDGSAIPQDENGNP